MTDCSPADELLTLEVKVKELDKSVPEGTTDRAVEDMPAVETMALDHHISSGNE